MNPYDLYKKQDIETSNNQELVGKLFNEASLSLKRAMKAIDSKKLDAANDCIKKSQVIVNTLNNSLDMQYEISSDLRKLYTYMLRRMVEANLKKDKAILEEISGMLAELRDTWAEAIRRSKKMQL
jgi:flagellar protein FliS